MMLTLDSRPKGSHQSMWRVPSITSRSTIGTTAPEVSQSVRSVNSCVEESVRRTLSRSGGETATQRYRNTSLEFVRRGSEQISDLVQTRKS